jgi:hypothetical protein
MATKPNKGEANQSSAATQDIHITEGVRSTWYYHLSEAGTNITSLCGKQTMHTAIPLSAWGVRGHLNERWCPQCAQMGAAALAAAGVQLNEQGVVVNKAN